MNNKIKLAVLVICIAVIFSGCGKLISVTSENSVRREISAFDDVSELYGKWAPMKFAKGESYNYYFVINTGEYVVDGNFELTVGGKAPDGLKFAWRFTIGSEELNGGYYGNNDKFLSKLNAFCEDDPIMSMVFEAIVNTYSTASFYSMMADYDDFEIGTQIKSDHMGVEYVHTVKEKSTFGKIDGFLLESAVEGVVTNVVCVSPFTSLPIYTLFFTDSQESGDSYIMCNLEGAILP